MGPKFQLNNLRVEIAFCTKQYLLKVPISEQRLCSNQGAQLFQYRCQNSDKIKGEVE